MAFTLPPGLSIELRPGFTPRPDFSHVVFDFDGTLSWLRHGWPELMFGLFRPHYPALPGESEAVIRETLLGDILSLNGKPSIHQMRSFVERVRARGGTSPDAQSLLADYQHALDTAIVERVRKMHAGRAEPDEFVVHGARTLLGQLQARGCTLVILSGTLEHRVREEAEWLGLADYFGPHIYGSHPPPAPFSKQEVLERLLREERISGAHLLSFGDGPVEIHSTKAIGGLAVAVASDETHNGSGQPDAIKRGLLLEAGADAVIADFREPAALLQRLTQTSG